jgi:hypothetical protein
MGFEYYNIHWHESEGCHIFECRYNGHNGASKERFSLKIWQENLGIARERANCCLDLINALEQQDKSDVVSLILGLLKKGWTHKDIVNAYALLKTNNLLEVRLYQTSAFILENALSQLCESVTAELGATSEEMVWLVARLIKDINVRGEKDRLKSVLHVLRGKPL